MKNDEIDLKNILENVDASLEAFLVEARVTVPREIRKEFERTARKCRKAIARAKIGVVVGNESSAASIRAIHEYSDEIAEICERAWPGMEFRRLGQEPQSTGSKA